MAKILPVSEISTLQFNDKKTILVGGCFDILHKGHELFLKNAKDQGDVLIVLLESDQHIKKMKGDDRPVNSLSIRAKNLSEITIIDYIILLPEEITDNTYDEIVSLIKPDIIATTKGDPFIQHKNRQVEKNGGKVVEVIERLKDYSSTNLI